MTVFEVDRIAAELASDWCIATCAAMLLGAPWSDVDRVNIRAGNTMVARNSEAEHELAFYGGSQ